MQMPLNLKLLGTSGNGAALTATDSRCNGHGALLALRKLRRLAVQQPSWSSADVEQLLSVKEVHQPLLYRSLTTTFEPGVGGLIALCSPLTHSQRRLSVHGLLVRGDSSARPMARAGPGSSACVVDKPICLIVPNRMDVGLATCHICNSNGNSIRLVVRFAGF